MKHPLWFKRSSWAHWTPCSWQGWLVVAIYTVFILAEVFSAMNARAAHQMPMVWTCVAATAALLLLVISTDDRTRRE